VARIRTIKPEFFTSLTVASLSLHARLTFIGLWTHVDDEGRCVDDARLVKAAVWPLDDRVSADVETDLKELSESSLIARYKVGDRSFLAVTGWREHQRINRPTKSKLPGPDQADPEPALAPVTSSNGHVCALSAAPHEQLTEGSRQERNREQGTGNREQGTNTRPARARTTLNRTEVEAFERFWAAYPRREAKRDAQKAWKAATTRTNPATILAGAERYRDYGPRQRAEPKYTKLPATWLNRDCWEDQLATDRPAVPDRRPSATDRAVAEAMTIDLDGPAPWEITA